MEEAKEEIAIESYKFRLNEGSEIKIMSYVSYLNDQKEKKTRDGNSILT